MAIRSMPLLWGYSLLDPPSFEDYRAECHFGERYSDAFYEHLRARDEFIPILGHIVDQADLSTNRGMWVGFFCALECSLRFHARRW